MPIYELARDFLSPRVFWRITPQVTTSRPNLPRAGFQALGGHLGVPGLLGSGAQVSQSALVAVQVDQAGSG